MRKRTRRGIAAAEIVAFGLAIAVCCPAQAEEKLAGYNAAIGESSISGISSGAFMAVQFATAWSSVIKGVGVVAGGPYWCAKVENTWGFWTLAWDYWNWVKTALGPCMKGPMTDLNTLFARAEANSASGAIDSLEFVRRQKIYVFHGYNDKIVARSATDAAAEFYRRYLGDARRGNLFYQTAIGAGHALVVAQQADGLKECTKNESPYIDVCSPYDQAGIILQHIYGPLSKPGPGPLTGTMKEFNQSAYTGSDAPSSLSLANVGYVFVPKACQNGEACRVHVALHGCKQDAGGEVKRAFVDRTGYNAWADANRLIVLYPQTISSWLPLNRDACWDWWGYVSYNDNYVTKGGLQIKAIKAMLDALTSRAVPVSPAVAAGSLALTVIDTSDVAADLVWTPQAGATGYRVSRAGAGGPFVAVADVPSPGFADTGLAPKSSYRWRVTPLANGVEGSPSSEAEAVTQPTPVCTKPGSCPWPN
jgi:hypothetical protein